MNIQAFQIEQTKKARTLVVNVPMLQRQRYYHPISVAPQRELISFTDTQETPTYDAVTTFAAAQKCDVIVWRWKVA